MKKGFTLIELLAVIVILAIIALIAVPIVLNIINDAKEESLKRSIDNYKDVVEQAIYRYTLKTGKSVTGSFKTDGHKIEQGNISIDVYYKGNIECDDIVVDEKGKIFVGSCKVDGKSTDYSNGEMKYNVLAEVETFYSETEGLKPITDKFLNTSVPSKKISKFEIHTKGINVEEGYEKTDCSKYKNNSVVCYWKEINNTGYYEMNIAANGDVYTPKNATELFYEFGYEELESLDLTGLNTKYSENMRGIFNKVGHEFMETINLGNDFDTSNVIDMRSMFMETGYKKMTSLDLGDKFDTSNVTNMYSMFYKTGHDSMGALNLRDKFDTSKVTNMYSMFAYTGYTKMTSLDLGDQFDTSNVTNMLQMFYKAGYMEMINLNLGNKFDTHNVTDMQNMFGYTGFTKMTSLDLGDQFDTSNVTNMLQMFRCTGYTKMTSLALGDKFNTSNVTNMINMFYATGYNKMTTLNLGKKFTITTGTTTTSMFDYCGQSGVLTSVVVGSEDTKTKVSNLAPAFWRNNNIITVQTT